jgi:hypothetical protein
MAAAQTPCACVSCWEYRLTQNSRAWLALREARELDHRVCLLFHLESPWETAASIPPLVGKAASPVPLRELAPAPAWLLS